MSENNALSTVIVRAVFAEGGTWSPDLVPMRAAAFDRWLAQHDAELREQIVSELKAAHKQSVASGYAYEHTFEDGLAEAAMIVRGVL